MQSLKAIFFLAILLINSLYSQSQKVTVVFFDSTNNIPFVNVCDTGNKISIAADEEGKIQLRPGKYKLYISHVSYEPQVLELDATNGLAEKDIKVFMKKRDENLSDVIIAPKKINQHIYETGNFKNSGEYGYGLYQNLKAGVYIQNLKDTKTHFLRSIKFKLKKEGLVLANSFIMEIKIYEIQNGLISLNAINKIPIYVNAGSLKKRNEIMINEKLATDSKELFISFEIPYVKIENSLKIVFVGELKAAVCETFFMRNNIPWAENILQSDCRHYDYEKNLRLSIGITYKNEK